MPNRLAHSASPYLRQHADNPVAWWPWCDEAFAEARTRDVPVLVSIGYSTCHWCHVMAHESFEDPETAAVMNDHFVCIKVDREEHPEVDEMYMDAVQAMTGHGGWPLNAFTDHDGRPFYALTYLPHGQWTQLCHELSRLWTTDRARITTVAADVQRHLTQAVPTPGALNDTVWQRLDQGVTSTYDAENPGFAYNEAKAPKFPSSQLLPVLMDDGRPQWRQYSENILEAMQDSGLHDRVGGGFHRYSVTPDWRLPHFEKMLYDNAQLMGVYARAGALLNRPDFMQTAMNTGDYFLRDMRVMDGDTFLGYASAEDADDPNGEGSFYAWSPEDLISVLGDSDGRALATAWNVSPGEREAGPHGHLDPVVSHIPQPRGTGLKGADAATQAQRASWEIFLPRLRVVRDARPRPSRDDKVVTDVNGLALEGFAALARYAPAADRPRFEQATRELADRLRARRTDTGLLRLPGKTAYITDYGHLISGYTAAYYVLGDATLIDEACAVAAEAVDRLRAEDGGFYTTPAGREDLFRRSREESDNAYPSGQNALAVGFVRLWMITGDDIYRTWADGILASGSTFAMRAPTAATTLLAAYRTRSRGPLTAVQAGSDAALHLACLQATNPDVAIVDADQAGERPWECLADRRNLTPAQVLICLPTACLAPAFTAADVQQRFATLLK